MVDAGPRGDAPLPVWLVTGFRRPARVRLIEALLAARPAGEAWSLAANGLPPPLPPDPAVGVFTLPTGCPCCTGTTPFQVGMTRLLRGLRESPPRRLLVEVAEAAHVERVRTTLADGAWAIRVAATIAVLEAGDLAAGAAHAAQACTTLAAAADLAVVAPPADPAARAFAAAHARVQVPDDWPQVTALAAGLIAQAAT